MHCGGLLDGNDERVEGVKDVADLASDTIHQMRKSSKPTVISLFAHLCVRAAGATADVADAGPISSLNFRIPVFRS